MRATFVLTPFAARRLIAKGTAADPLVKQALSAGRVMIATGVTNAYVCEELTGRVIADKWRYGVGIVTGEGLGVTSVEERIPPVCLLKGKVVDVPWQDFMREMTAGDVLIKGCNAFDSQGYIGVLLGGEGGGTVGNTIGWVWSRGINLVTPVGHEKLIPSVPEAARYLGIHQTDLCTGMKVGMAVISNAHLVTEVTALDNLLGIQAVVAAGGGYNGAEGAAVLAAEGEPKQLEQLWEMVRALREEPPVSRVILQQ